MDGVEAIVFDVDNTLIDTAGADRVAYENVWQLLQANYADHLESVDSVIETFQRSLTETSELDSTVSTDVVRTNVWREALTRNSIEEMPDASSVAQLCHDIWNKTRANGFYLTPQVSALVRRLKLGFKIGIITNGPTDVQTVKMECINSCVPRPDLFDCVLISGSLGYHKPDPRIFQDACSMLASTPETTVIVGDSLDTDILGGNSAGWRTIWFNPTGKKCHSASKQPTVEITTLHDLPLVIKFPPESP